ncbi:carboxylate-amine ligase [Saccharothrix tamanrassetensis]|uniref:Putative glutamate--cysteine ligase 2 n=1 Tax=Saccharothrix tamanrassetensis TaxID=1051531 RepID=A0A841CIM0_9PSEU|nr:glutamate--cysteine ligase [Saccharothrix tamanrassetensis]MBB5957281.1 carboxylate-amine ligase [Saccharothrix tamanrassetensis]
MPPALTLGVEEEFLLVDPRTGEPAPHGREVAEAARRRFGVDLDVELVAAQVETRTAVCHDLADVRGQLHGLRMVAAETARGLGCRLLAVGVAPVGGPDLRTGSEDRYRRLAGDYRLLAAEQSICGCHVHVAVPDPETAVRVCNHVRPWLPVLGTVTANSPFARGLDTGYASWRSIVWARWPSAGPPPYFESPEHYESTCNMMVESGAAHDLRNIYWDVRPSSHLPTVEVRVADVAATVDEAVLLAALVRGLVATALAGLRRGLPAPPVPTEVLRAAMWRAARDGITGMSLDVFSGRLEPTRLLLDRLVHHVRDHLGAADLDLVRHRLSALDADGGGAARQRQAFARAGRMSDVLELLARDTLSGSETWTDEPSTPTA